jgi:hypothetical protein
LIFSYFTYTAALARSRGRANLTVSTLQTKHISLFLKSIIFFNMRDADISVPVSYYIQLWFDKTGLSENLLRVSSKNMPVMSHRRRCPPPLYGGVWQHRL